MFLKEKLLYSIVADEVKKVPKKKALENIKKPHLWKKNRLNSYPSYVDLFDKGKWEELDKCLRTPVNLAKGPNHESQESQRKDYLLDSLPPNMPVMYTVSLTGELQPLDESDNHTVPVDLQFTPSLKSNSILKVGWVAIWDWVVVIN